MQRSSIRVESRPTFDLFLFSFLIRSAEGGGWGLLLGPRNEEWPGLQKRAADRVIKSLWTAGRLNPI